MPKSSKPRRSQPPTKKRGRKEHLDSTTDRPETPILEGIDPVTEEITGRASKVDDNLATLFDQESNDHLVDGFKGGSGDVPEGEEPPER